MPQFRMALVQVKELVPTGKADLSFARSIVSSDVEPASPEKKQ